jgi:hypothetical protein
MRRAAAVLSRAFGATLWRDQRGEVLTGLVVAAASVLVALGAFGTVGTGIDRQRINQCIGTVTDATAKLKERYPENAVVPSDDIEVVRIQSCRSFVEQLTKDSTLGNGAAIKNLSNLVDQGLQRLGKCEIDYLSPAAPSAGLAAGILVTATIPFYGANTTAIATTTVNGKSISAPLAGGGRSCCAGFLAIPSDTSASAAGEVSPVTVTATSVVARTSGGCIPPSTEQGGQCVIACTTPAQNLVWANPTIPDIKLFLAQPSTIDPASPTPVVLAWSVADAKAVTIDQGVGEVDRKSGSSFELPPDQDTTYTLTAVGARPQDTRTAQQTVKVTNSQPLSVSITSPGGNAQLTTTSVAVTGKVTPAPGKTLPGTITVNGASAVPVTVDASGNFSGAVTLDKITSTGVLALNNPSLGITTCGDRSTTVTVTNNATPASVQNTIEVTVTDGARQASAAVVVFHAVRITSFVVNWLSCPPLNKNLAMSSVVNASQTVTAGTVDCGCKNSPGGCHATCTVQASVGTSVGTVQNEATWTFNVASCP